MTSREYIDCYKVRGSGRTHKACGKCQSLLPVGRFSLRGPKSKFLKAYCDACHNAESRNWAKENRTAATAAKKKHYHLDVDASRAKQRKWAQNNPEKVKEYSRNDYVKNAETKRAIRKKYYKQNKKAEAERYKKWAMQNRHLRTASQMRRSAAKKQAVAGWADFDRMRQIYKTCEKVTHISGKLHHVDHIVPLQSKYVCGLHVHDNLRIAPAHMNQSKGNRQWPGMFDEVKF